MLIARWNSGQDPAVDPPTTFTWGDGRTATEKDYHRYRDATREFVETDDGIEQRFYPDLIGHVRYDAFDGNWFVTAPNREPLSLDLSDPEATNEQLTAALADLPILYRAVIHRSGGWIKAK
jgi:hypothetical protein